METARPGDSDVAESAALSRRVVVLGVGVGGVMGALLGGLLAASAQEASPMAGTPAAGGTGAYLAIRQYRFAAGYTMEELVETVESGFMPIVSEVPGYLEYYLVESADGPLSISVFQDQAGAEESTRRAAEWVQEALAGFFEGPPTVTTGTVQLHHNAGEPTAGP